MRTFDFTPYRRSTVGFDRLFDLLETGMRQDSTDSYPPFDIEKTDEDRYAITLAVAGFAPSDIEIVAQQNQLTVTGRKGEENRDESRYLHRGIATRAFERRFQLADFVVVENARFDNGLLRISLKREVPEAMRPRKIAIDGTPANDLIEAKDQAAA
jgi:molecular chaperone IbpA